MAVVDCCQSGGKAKLADFSLKICQPVGIGSGVGVGGVRVGVGRI